MRIRHALLIASTALPGLVVASGTSPVGADDDPGGGGGVNETIAVVRGNVWYSRLTPNGGPSQASFGYGRSSDVKLLGDWDGDGFDTPGVVRGNGWYLSNDFDGDHDIALFAFGRAGDKPVVGDWNNDGRDTPGIVRGATWYLSNDFDSDHDITPFTFGRGSDRPVVGDWNGDGRDTPGQVRGAMWYLSNDFDGDHDIAPFNYGRASDKVLAGDWNSDRKDTPGVVRDNLWYLNDHFDSSHSRPVFSFGRGTDVVVTHSGPATTTPPPTDPIRTRIVQIAAGEVGTQEWGDNCNPYGWCDEWCAMFAEWVWRQAGVSPVFDTAVAAQVGQWGIDNGLWKSRPAGTRGGNPQPGDIVLWGPPGTETGGHVGIVETVRADGWITTIDGNYPDAVVRRVVDPLVDDRPGEGGRYISGYVKPPGT